ncbi:MAG: hypothetical protein LC745_11105, partial [Planctomycetia bacterium]|nr:hypothetical protein [Planctomycetia bacterium]
MSMMPMPTRISVPPPVSHATRLGFRMVVSERNSPALFGAGRIDAIPDSVIEAEAFRQSYSTGLAGRVSRLRDGRVGRFGWKAQVPNLDDFVRTACAVELGLEVPGHPQSEDPFGYGAHARGLDLSGDDCKALVGYVRGLPRPEERPSATSGKGRAVFDRTGCADCHRPDLGDVEGLYSDLLLHDMGFGLSDSGVYYGTDEESSPGVPKGPEWRTPPLWGVA